MADELETVLRRSLDAVDRGRRWAIIGVVALFVAMAIAVAALLGSAAAASTSASSASAIVKVLFVATATQILFVGCCTVVVMFHVSRTSKAIVRAMDLHRN